MKLHLKSVFYLQEILPRVPELIRVIYGTSRLYLCDESYLRALINPTAFEHLETGWRVDGPIVTGRSQSRI